MRPIQRLPIIISCLIGSLATAQPDSSMINLAGDYFIKSFRSAAQRQLHQSIRYADSSLQVYQEISNEWGIAKHQFLLGIHKRVTGEYPAAKSHFEACRKAMESYLDTNMLASVHFQLAIINEALGDLDEALAHQYRSIGFYEKLGTINDTNDGLNNLGSIYRKLKQYDNSQELYQRSLKINEGINSIAGQATNHVNLGNLYAEQSRYQEAIASYSRAVYFDSLDNFDYGLASDYENIGNLLVKQAKYAEALKQHTAALDLRLQLPSAHEKAISYQKTAEVQLLLDKPRQALSFLDSAELYTSKTQALEVWQHIAATRASAHAHLRNFHAAYRHEKHASQLRDSMLNKSITDQISELNARYETTKKEKEIALSKC